jgi:hypothetical protein
MIARTADTTAQSESQFDTIQTARHHSRACQARARGCRAYVHPCLTKVPIAPARSGFASDQEPLGSLTTVLATDRLQMNDADPRNLIAAWHVTERQRLPSTSMLGPVCAS